MTEHRVARGQRRRRASSSRRASRAPSSARRAGRAPEAVDVDQATAWRRGKLIVRRQPLGDVLAALGRYHRGFVYCVDRAICARRVSGVFGAEDPLQSLQEIETSLGLQRDPSHPLSDPAVLTIRALHAAREFIS